MKTFRTIIITFTIISIGSSTSSHHYAQRGGAPALLNAGELIIMLNAGELIVLLIKVFHFFVLRTHLTGMLRYFFVTTILRNFTSLFYFEEHHLSLTSVIIDIPLEALHFEGHYLAGVLLNDTSNTSELAYTQPFYLSHT